MCVVRVTRSIVSLLVSHFPTFQVLNKFFHIVCELDLVFNFYKVNSLMSNQELMNRHGEKLTSVPILCQIILQNAPYKDYKLLVLTLRLLL